jgi:Transcriptional Coactivator p15 (PC4)
MAKSAASEQVIGAVERTRREELRVSIRRANGKRILDIRVFVQDEFGKMIPTARGVLLSSDQWKQLREILMRLNQERGGAGDARTSPRPSS